MEKEIGVLAELGCTRVAAPAIGAETPLDLLRAGERYKKLLELGRKIGVNRFGENETVFLGFPYGGYEMKKSWGNFTYSKSPRQVISIELEHKSNPNQIGFTIVSLPIRMAEIVKKSKISTTSSSKRSEVSCTHKKSLCPSTLKLI